MPISINQIRIGGFYEAGNHQLRKITTLEPDSLNPQQVIYEDKSIRIPNRAFTPAATLETPATTSTFSKDCIRELTATDITNLRNKNIILSNE